MFSIKAQYSEKEKNMRKYIFILSIVSSALIAETNYSAASAMSADLRPDQAVRGLINDLFCFYVKGFLHLECWYS